MSFLHTFFYPCAFSLVLQVRLCLGILEIINRRQFCYFLASQRVCFARWHFSSWAVPKVETLAHIIVPSFFTSSCTYWFVTVKFSVLRALRFQKVPVCTLPRKSTRVPIAMAFLKSVWGSLTSLAGANFGITLLLQACLSRFDVFWTFHCVDSRFSPLPVPLQSHAFSHVARLYFRSQDLCDPRRVPVLTLPRNAKREVIA